MQIDLFSNSSAVATIATLANCSASVEEGCTVPTVDSTTLASCETSFKAVETKNSECLALLTAASPVQYYHYNSRDNS